MSSDAQSSDRLRLRLFVAGLIAGVAAICVIVAVSVVLVAHYFSRDDADPLVPLRAKYQHEYDQCRRVGGGDAACTEKAGDACISDPYFATDGDLSSDISDTCLDFTAVS